MSFLGLFEGFSNCAKSILVSKMFQGKTQYFAFNNFASTLMIFVSMLFSFFMARLDPLYFIGVVFFVNIFCIY